ncbi:MAG: fibrobacter succinogenes major paralogous domain-containing protein [Prevotellaceae bacterium]|nr:fibrobacter succinogenes major paralogous domain-containing protein [Prevotellaceae bacterium]
MKTNQFLFAALTAVFLNVANYAAAQVTIGGSDAPKAGAILDLNSTTKGGLQLSNVNFSSYTTIPVGFPGINSPGDVTPAVKEALTGAVVYNVNHDFGMGIFVWDGNRWQPIGAQIYSTTVPAPTYLSSLSSDFDVTFMAYNLGADVAKLMSLYPKLSPAKQQIKYLATQTYLTTEEQNSDATVYGDQYQWGRIRDGHEKRNSLVFGTAGVCPDVDLDANGQVAFGKARYGYFIPSKDEDIDDNDFNWRTRKDDLWGNGEALVGQTDNQGGVPVSSTYYQNTDRAMPQNDPCPSGWRIPTQDEWERLCNYDGLPGTLGGRVPTAAEGDMPATGQANTSANSAPLTWIPVAGGIVSTDWGGITNEKKGGYVVYNTADWDAATTVANGYFYNVDWSDSGNTKRLYDAAAPEPLLFLPAAGHRNQITGLFHYVINGYWSSTAYGVIYAYRLGFTNLYVTPYHNDRRAYTFPVRCVKE